MIEAKIIADSLNPVGVRLVTFKLTYPRFILAELNTHRVFSRNSASSRAVPIEKMIERVRANPVVPIHWGKNQPGMQASEQIGNPEQTISNLFMYTIFY
jgi:thymidylate synthase ThyX